MALSGYTDYSAAFYAHDILLLTAAVAIMAMPIGVKLPADDLLRDVWSILKMPHVTVFIFFMFLLGNYWGYIESFLFLYLKELGAPNYLLGKLTHTVLVTTKGNKTFPLKLKSFELYKRNLKVAAI